MAEGWFVALSSLGLSSLFGYIAASRFNWLPTLDDSQTRAWLRLIIFTGFGVALLWVSVLLLLAQIDSDERRSEWASDHGRRNRAHNDIPGHCPKRGSGSRSRFWLRNEIPRRVQAESPRDLLAPRCEPSRDRRRACSIG